MSKLGGLSATDILTYLASDGRPDAREAARPSSEQVQAYREAAAVLVALDDPEGLRPLGGESANMAVTELLGADLIPATGRKFDGRVMLAPDVRSQTIRELASSGRLEDALAVNPGERDSPLQAHFEQYLRREAPPLESQSLEELDSTRQVSLWLGGVVEGIPTEEEVNARSAYLKLLEPFEAIAGDGVFRGRKRELDDLRHYIGVVSPESAMKRLQSLFRWAEPERQPAVSISGVGGVGKSTLVARFMLEHTRLREDARVPFGYLDFERAGLDVGDPLGLFLELLRQLDIQFPGDDRFADIRDRAVAQWGDHAKFPVESRLAAARDLLGDVLQRIRSVFGPRPYVVVLDTFEQVQYRGEARALPLWDLLAGVQDRAPSLRVVVAGRAPVESLRLAGKPPRQIILAGLDDESARAFLSTQGISDPALQDKLVRTFGRVPLSLKLVGLLAARTPGGATALLDPALTGDALVAASDELIQGQLYERILGRIDNEQVRRLANPGLVLRRINPSVILEVLNEPCGLGIRTLSQSRALFDQLQRETSLVSVDSSDGDLVHRADLRRVMLKLLLTSTPAQVEQIRRRAVAWYARRSDRRGRAEEIYHRLHLGDRVDDKELSDREVRSSIQTAIEEFPLQVQLRLATLGFDVPREAREQATFKQHHASLAAQIEELLPYGSSSESQAEAIFASAQNDLRHASPLFRAGARIAGQGGDERRALDLIGRGLEYSIQEGAAAQTLGLLQERAWLCRNRSRADQASGLALLHEHALRNQDRAALLQHQAQTISLGDRPIERDLVVLADLLREADPDDMWGLAPALQPAVQAARWGRGEALLAQLRILVQAQPGPFRYAVFPDPVLQSILEGLLFTSSDAGTGPFGDAFLHLCETWPYRILFVAAPYGRRGEQLYESA